MLMGELAGLDRQQEQQRMAVLAANFDTWLDPQASSQVESLVVESVVEMSDGLTVA